MFADSIYSKYMLGVCVAMSHILAAVLRGVYFA